MRRNGFTLVEVLVILAILAALAAVLVPTVSNQVRKADIGRVTGDLTNLRSGIEAFLVNVHRYPGDIEDLVFPVDVGVSDADIQGDDYSTGLAGRWEGPYIDRSIGEGGTLDTGFAGEIHDDFWIDSVSVADVYYLTVSVTGIARPEFDLIDENIDDGNGIADGRLRYVTNATADTIYFHALPIN